MKITKKKLKKKQLIILIIAVVVLLVGGFFAYAAINRVGPFAASQDTVNYNPPTDEQREDGNRTAEEAKTQDTDETAKPSEDEGNPSNEDDQTVGVEITAAEQSENVLTIRTLVQSVDPGTCTLTLAQVESATITEVAETQSLSSISTCRGFTIPTTNLARGEWNLTITFSGSATGSASQTITIN